ncbi:MAG: nuclear transport factor 2 family protein [Hyphomonadaceae bacterium]
MSVEVENHKAVLRRFSELLRNPNAAAIRTLFTEDFELHAPNEPNWPRGHEGAIRMLTQMHERFPDLDVIAEEQHAHLGVASG